MIFVGYLADDSTISIGILEIVSLMMFLEVDMKGMRVGLLVSFSLYFLSAWRGNYNITSDNTVELYELL